jgi:DNA-binding transcriptional regulator GbsR (MarR family)
MVSLDFFCLVVLQDQNRSRQKGWSGDRIQNLMIVQKTLREIHPQKSNSKLQQEPHSDVLAKLKEKRQFLNEYARWLTNELLKICIMKYGKIFPNQNLS